MHYLITGGAGFIGGHLSESLLGEGHKVSIIDNLSTCTEDNIRHIRENKNFRFYKADILDFPDMDKVVPECDIIIHLAAAVGVELVVHEPVRTITTNVHGTEVVLDAASKHKKKIMIASTSEVYGKSPKKKFSINDDLLIGSPVNSRWSYACSKLLDEFLMMAFYREYGLQGIVVRFFNTVGPRQTGRYGMVLPRFVEAALKGNPIKVFGTGEQTRCFCHVYDTVRAIKALSVNDNAVGGIFNIGNTQSVSMSELAETVKRLLGSTSEIVKIPYDVAYEKGFEDMMHRVPDTKEIRKLTGWKPEHDLEHIILDVAEYIKKHRNFK